MIVKNDVIVTLKKVKSVTAKSIEVKISMKNIKFDNGKKHRYLIAYWPFGAAQWSWVSHIIDTEDDFKRTMLYLVQEYEIWNETESQEDICVFKLTDTPQFTMVTKKETIETLNLDFS